LAEIRGLHRAKGVPIKEIPRRLGVARNTVRAALNSDRPPKYERARETLRAVVDSPLPDDVRHQTTEHAAIVAAIETGDADAAERAAALCLHRAVTARESTRPSPTGTHDDERNL
jgi:DNA-binding GntR family transcriptional regulator